MTPSDRPAPRGRPLRCQVVVEQTLGHVTHSQNLRRLLPETGLDVNFVPIEFDVDGWKRRVPGFGNWTIRAGIRAKAALRAESTAGRGHPDVRLVHTQVPAVLLRSEMQAVPTVVSLDATPRQYDALGEHYDHAVGRPTTERLKTELNRRCFERAAHLITWAAWTKESLVDDYGIDPHRITVIPPGVDVERWTAPDATPDDGTTRILFVGGDLARKGGHDLLAAFAQLRAIHGANVELHLVTPRPVAPPPGVNVHSTMTPNSADLIELYHRCQIFCLPTRGDCLPMVLPEAAAAGLALVSSRVGAIPEIVRDSQTGLLVDPGDVGQLVMSLDRLVSDRELRTRIAAAASALVRAEHSASRNAGHIAGILRAAAETGSA
ncbi:MAG: glycosyltransferase family 4 protein [Ilumatobacteraceae bacterium]|nr:glycosyltransferase family 4 protein [Ilumatobacteraceae bacterium]